MARCPMAAVECEYVDKAHEGEAINARWSAVARAVGELAADAENKRAYLETSGVFGYKSEHDLLIHLEQKLQAVLETLRTGDLPEIEKALGIEVKK